MVEFERVEEDNKVVGYKCTELLENNQSTLITVEYFYDFLRNESDDLATVLRQQEEELLSEVALEVGLQNGERCLVPPVSTIWLVEVQLGPDGEPVPNFSNCLELDPSSAERCAVYKGWMTGSALGDDNPESFYAAVETAMKTIGKRGDKPYQIEFLGTSLDTNVLDTQGNSNLGPAKIEGETNIMQVPTPDDTFTPLGVLVICAFVLAFLALFGILYRRRQQFLRAHNLEYAKSDFDDLSSTDRPETRSPELQVVPMEAQDSGEGHEIFPQGYTFDLAASMKNELYGLHGIGVDGGKVSSNALVPVDDGMSESDADSWAQTDGTIGSLDPQLEPITAEV